MSAKIIPANPAEVMVIRNITPNVVTLSVPFLRHGVLKIGGRGTLGKSPPHCGFTNQCQCRSSS